MSLALALLVVVLALRSDAAAVVAAEEGREDEELLALLQKRAFEYLWNEANEDTGLVQDCSSAENYCSIAASIRDRSSS